MLARQDATCMLSKENGCVNASARAAVRPRQTLSLASLPPRLLCPQPLPRLPPCLPRVRGADVGGEGMEMRRGMQALHESERETIAVEVAAEAMEAAAHRCFRALSPPR